MKICVTGSLWNWAAQRWGGRRSLSPTCACVLRPKADCACSLRHSSSAGVLHLVPIFCDLCRLSVTCTGVLRAQADCETQVLPMLCATCKQAASLIKSVHSSSPTIVKYRANNRGLQSSQTPKLCQCSGRKLSNYAIPPPGSVIYSAVAGS